VQTWRSAGDLSASSVKQSWAVLLTVALAGLLGLALSVMGHYADHKAEESQDQKSKSDKATMILASRSERKKQFHTDPAGMVDECLPSVLRETPLSVKISREMKVFHRWFGVVFFYSAHFKRSYRVLSLFTSAIIMMAANALTYVIAYPDDGSCATYDSETDCIAPQSSLNGGSKCEWISDPSSADGDYCEFREPANDIVQVVFVAIIAAMFSTPLALMADYVIMQYIAAEVKSYDSVMIENTKSRLQEARARFKSSESTSEDGVRTSSNSSGRKAVIAVDTNSKAPAAIRPPSLARSKNNRVGSDDASNSTLINQRATKRASRNLARRRSSGSEADGVLLTSLQEDMKMLLKDMRTFRDKLNNRDRQMFDGKAALKDLSWCINLCYLFLFGV
jgi:hypothetical protein